MVFYSGFNRRSLQEIFLLSTAPGPTWESRFFLRIPDFSLFRNDIRLKNEYFRSKLPDKTIEKI